MILSLVARAAKWWFSPKQRIMYQAAVRLADVSVYWSDDYEQGRITDEQLVSDVVQYGAAIVPYLVNFGHYSHRDNVIKALVRIGDKQAIHFLLANSKSYKLRFTCLEALRTWENDPAVKEEIRKFERQLEIERQGIFIFVTGVVRKVRTERWRQKEFWVSAAVGYLLGTANAESTWLDFPEFWASEKDIAYPVNFIHPSHVGRDMIPATQEGIEEIAIGTDTRILKDLIDIYDDLRPRENKKLYPLDNIYSDAEMHRKEILYLDPTFSPPNTPFFISATPQLLQTRKVRCLITLNIRSFKDFPYLLMQQSKWQRSLPESPTLDTIGDKGIQIEDGMQLPLNLIDKAHLSPMLVTVQKHIGQFSYMVEIIQGDNLSDVVKIQERTLLGLSIVDIDRANRDTKTYYYDFAVVDSVLSSETV